MWHDMYWHGWGYHMFSWWGVAVMGVLIAAIAWIIARSNAGEAHLSSANETPMEILERRYADGEIERQEFEQKRRDLLG